MAANAGTNAKPGDPFKMTTVALLVVAVVMALVFSTNSMSRKIDDGERLAAAAQEVEAVGLFLDDDDLPNAIVALHDVGRQLGAVPGAEDAAIAVSDAVVSLIDEREALKSELGASRAEVLRLKRQLAEARQVRDGAENRATVLSTVRDRNALILGNLVSGQHALARRLLDTTPEKDVVATAMDRLLARIEALNEAAAAVGAERTHGLNALARVWPVPGARRFAEFATAEENRRLAVENALGQTRTALESGDNDAALKHLDALLRAAGVPAAGPLSHRLWHETVAQVAAAAEKQGDLAAARAGYRVTGMAEEERRVDTALRRQQNRALLGDMANLAIREGRLFSAGALLGVAHELTGEAEFKHESDTAFARAWVKRAEEHFLGIRFEAARDTIVRASHYKPEEAADLSQKIEEEYARFQVADAVGLARQALDAGAPALAAERIRNVEAPEDLRAAIRAALNDRARNDAVVALHRGDGARALELLASAADSDPLKAHANLLAGDIPAGVAGLPGEPEARAAKLVSIGWVVLPKEPARAARLGLAALGVTGARPGTIALLKTALENAGEVPKGDALWDEVRAVIFAATTGMPGEK